MAAAARGPAPVTLRDFLELGCDSSSDGFRSYPRCLPWTDDALLLQAPVRLLVEADLHRNPSRSPSSLFSLARSPSRSPSSLFSLARTPGGALARISSLSRSFSRRIKEGFWRRREDDDEEDDDLYFDDRDSCGFPSPQVSSCSASDSDSEADDDKMAACPSTSEPAAFQCDEKPSSSSSSSSSADHDCADDAAAAADGKKKKKMQAVAADGDPAAVGRGSKLGMEEDKQQLSPVSVLDFPFDDDDRSDAGTCSPSFHRRSCPPPPDLLHARSMTTKQAQAQLLHKIRRYDGIAQAVDPVDLEARFTTTFDDSGESADTSTHPATSSSCTDTTSTATTAACHGEEHQSVEQQPSQEEPDEYRLLARLLQEDTVAVVDDVLLLDFFTDGLDRLRCSTAAAGSVVGAVRRVVDDDGRDEVAAAEALVRAASEWMRGAGPQWGIRDVMLSGKAALEDMERGRRWMCVGEEEREVGAAVEGFVVDGLLDELVEELLCEER